MSEAAAIASLYLLNFVLLLTFHNATSPSTKCNLQNHDNVSLAFYKWKASKKAHSKGLDALRWSRNAAWRPACPERHLIWSLPGPPAKWNPSYLEHAACCKFLTQCARYIANGSASIVATHCDVSIGSHHHTWLSKRDAQHAIWPGSALRSPPPHCSK